MYSPLIYELVEGFSSKKDRDKAISIFELINNGNYFKSSTKRDLLFNTYHDLILKLRDEDYLYLKLKIIPRIKEIIFLKAGNISYSGISKLIKFSCKPTDYEVLNEYEKEVLRLADINKSKYFYHVITMAQTKFELSLGISDIEDFVIKRYLQPVKKTNNVNTKYLLDFTTNVTCSKEKFMKYLLKMKPFGNDHIIKTFIRWNPELDKYSVLL